MTWQGRVQYQQALDEMERLRDAMIASPGSPGTLLLCEHPPTITCGKSSLADNVLLSADERERRGIGLVAIERGGDVTYHGPGQLMIYPIVRVGVRVSAFLESLSGALSELTASYGIDGAAWEREEAGLWLGGRKLAACGLHLRRGVSIHGFSFNVRTPPEDWHCIVPCGLSGPGPISLKEAMAPDSAPSVEAFAMRARPILERALESYGLDPNARGTLG